MITRALSFHLRFGLLWLRIALIALVAALPLVSVSEASLHDTGQWSESEYGYGSDWRDLYGNSYAIHMALTRGEGTPYHSHIIWWSGSRHDFGGRELAWRPFTNDCEYWPDSNFVPITVSWPGMDMFCSGHNGLADGRLLIAGGNDSVNSIAGERGARVWQPGTAQGSGNWVNANKMREHRWYPTTTVLADGRVLVLTGYQNEHHVIFGGRRDGVVPSQEVADSIGLYEPVPGGRWFQGVIPDSVMSNVLPNKPEWREYHSAVCMEEGYGQFQRRQSTSAERVPRAMPSPIPGCSSGTTTSSERISPTSGRRDRRHPAVRRRDAASTRLWVRRAPMKRCTSSAAWTMAASP